MSDTTNTHPPNEDSSAQRERTKRARRSLREQVFHITRTNPGQWTVQNGEKMPYTVMLQPPDGGAARDNTWTCTCPDYQQRGRGAPSQGSDLRCKHIEAVRLSEEAAASPDPTQTQQEVLQHMSEQIHPTDTADKALWELRQPLDMSRVKRRQAPGTGSVPYLEGHDIIDRANVIFDYQWSFVLLSQPVVLRWQRAVTVWDNSLRKKVPVVKDGQPVTDEVGMVYITGKVVIEINGRQYEHADIGRCIFSGDTPEALDMALAGSATDCLKRCFRQAGEQFGNSLYDKEIAGTAGLQDQGKPGSGGNGSKNPSEKVSAPSRSKPPSQSAGKTTLRQYADGSNVNGNATEQKAYDHFVRAHKGQLPASREVLREWVKDNPPRTEEQILKELGYE